MIKKKKFFISGYYLKSNKYNFILAQNLRAASKSIKQHYQKNVILDNFFLKTQIKLAKYKIIKPLPEAHSSLKIIKEYIGQKKFNKFIKIFVARDSVSWIRSILIHLANGNKDIVESNYEKLDTIDNILKKIKDLKTTLTQSQFIYDQNGNLICDYCLDYSKLPIALNTIGKKISFSFHGLQNFDKINSNFLNDNKLLINKMKPTHETNILCKEIWSDDFQNFGNFESGNDGLIINKIKSNTPPILSEKIYQASPYFYLVKNVEKLIKI